MTDADSGVPEIKEYDKNNNEIHYRDTSGYEWWSEYDENGNEIHTRDSTGYEAKITYDEHGKRRIVEYPND